MNRDLSNLINTARDSRNIMRTVADAIRGTRPATADILLDYARSLHNAINALTPDSSSLGASTEAEARTDAQRPHTPDRCCNDDLPLVIGRDGKETELSKQLRGSVLVEGCAEINESIVRA